MSQPLKMFIARDIMYNLREYQICRYQIVHYLLNSWNLISHIILLISRLPHISQKRFCTPNVAITHLSNHILGQKIIKTKEYESKIIFGLKSIFGLRRFLGLKNMKSNTSLVALGVPAHCLQCLHTPKCQLGGPKMAHGI